MKTLEIVAVAAVVLLFVGIIFARKKKSLLLEQY